MKKWRKMDADFTTFHSKLNGSYFDNKIIWITGASSGIGKTLAYHITSLNTKNTKLVLSARRETKLNEIKTDILEKYGGNKNKNKNKNNIKPDDIYILPLDLNETDTAYYISQYNSILKHFNTDRIGILINNAGFSMRSSFVDFDIKDTLNMIQVNLVSPIILTKLVLDDMKKNTNRNTNSGVNTSSSNANQLPFSRTGHIVNISSVSGRLWPATRSSYSVTKAGLVALGYSLSQELSNKDFQNATNMENVYVTSILPGPIATNVDIAAKGKHGEAHLKRDISIQSGLDATRCAQLICIAITNPKRIKESWIGNTTAIAAMYRNYYLPDLYDKTTRNVFGNVLMKDAGYLK